MILAVNKENLTYTHSLWILANKVECVILDRNNVISYTCAKIILCKILVVLSLSVTFVPSPWTQDIKLNAHKTFRTFSERSLSFEFIYYVQGGLSTNNEHILLSVHQINRLIYNMKHVSWILSNFKKSLHAKDRPTEWSLIETYKNTPVLDPLL